MTRSVLIIDDDAGFRRSMRAVLEAAGYSVQDAGSAEEALSCLERERVRVALVDLDLPHMNGFDLIRVIGRRFPEVATIATSGIYQELYLEIARNVGAAAALRKFFEGAPLPPGEWIRVISSATGESAGA
jgi:two-component system response regulator YesN